MWPVRVSAILASAVPKHAGNLEIFLNSDNRENLKSSNIEEITFF
jgi:hypothetical protein